MTTAYFANAVFTALMVAVAVGDAASLRIPNWLNLTIIDAYLLLALFSQAHAGFGVHLAGGLAVFAACLLISMFGTFGAGDVKLAGGIGLWLGFGPNLLDFSLLAALFMAVLLGLAGFVRTMPALLPPRILTVPWVGTLVDLQKPFRKVKLPVGIAIAAAGAVAIWNG